MKHTKGPWIVEPLKQANIDFNVSSDTLIVWDTADIQTSVAILTHANEANARLIASAPELLNVMKACVSALQLNPLNETSRQYVLHELCTAIFKAEGNTK